MPIYADFPTNEYETRCKKAQNVMEDKNIDVLLLGGIENVTYFSGFRRTTMSKRRGYFTILPKNDSPILILPAGEKNKAEEMSWLYPDNVRYFGGAYSIKQEDPNEIVVKEIKSLISEKGNVGLELDDPWAPMRVDISLADYEIIRSQLSMMKLVDCGGLLWELRMIKSPREIQCLTEACKITYQAFKVAFESMREGMTERELLQIAYLEMIKLGGFDDPLFAFLHIRSGPERQRIGDPRPTDKKIKKGDLVGFDGGAACKGYFADMIRLGCISPSTKQQEMFNVAAQACDKGVEMLVPGTPIKDVVSEALNVIKKAGYEKHIPFTVVGHGIGLDIHEPPVLDFPHGDALVQEGMVLAIEPFFKLEEGSYAQEDNLVVTKSGPKNLTPLKKTLQW
jgi:Xaa-Pro aminopeptidase